MSRPLISSLRTLASSSSRVGVRGILTGSTGASRGGTKAQARPQGAIGGVDPRIFSGNGVDGFLGPAELSRLNEWQSGLWTRLQAEVRNNPRLATMKLKWDNDKLDMTEFLAFTAREPSLALAFNYASNLINNSYFLEGLNAEERKEVPDYYKPLEERVAAYAEGITGGAWLWIVKSGEGLADFDVVPTFGAGTMLVTMRQQRGRQGLIPVFGTPATSGDAAPPPQSEDVTETPAAPTPRYASRTPAAEDVIPVAVLNLYQLAYLGEKYGVFGARQYAKDWFRAVNWDRVQHRASANIF